jgi:large subunit ribosomal protein L31
MKAEGHPKTYKTSITCTCGTVYETISTKESLQVGICASCHPFFSGQQRFIDTAGRIDKFNKRFGGSTLAATAQKAKKPAAKK